MVATGLLLCPSLVALADGIGTGRLYIFKLDRVTPELWKEAKDLLLKVVKLKWYSWIIAATHHCAFLQHVVAKVGLACQPLSKS